MDTVKIDFDRCIVCGSCVNVCVREIFDDSGDTLRLDRPEMCILCGHCKAVCTEDAIDIPSLDAEEFVGAPDRHLTVTSFVTGYPGILFAVGIQKTGTRPVVVN